MRITCFTFWLEWEKSNELVNRVNDVNWLIFYSLVVSTPLTNMKVNGKNYPMYCGKKTCSKPPTSVNRLINQNEFESNYQQLISRGPHLVLRVDMAMARVGKGLELEELPVSVSRDKSAIYK